MTNVVMNIMMIVKMKFIAPIKRIKDFEGMGIDGLAIVSAIIAQKDIVEATKELKKLFIENY